MLHILERKIQETSDSATFYFKKPLIGKFKYMSGQFITLSLNIDGQNHFRAYSLSSSPDLDKKSYCITVKRVKGGLVSNYMLDHVHIGSEIEVQKPNGTFKTFPKNSTNTLPLKAAFLCCPLSSCRREELPWSPHALPLFTRRLPFPRSMPSAVLFRVVGRNFPGRLMPFRSSPGGFLCCPLLPPPDTPRRPPKQR